MSSTNKTAHLGLPQWESTDPVEAADFNGAFGALDRAVGGKLEAELICDLRVPEDVKDLSMLTMDLSEVNLGDYFCIIVSVPYVNTNANLCYNGASTGLPTGSGNNSTTFFAFPLKNASLKTNTVRQFADYVSAKQGNFSFSYVNSIDLAATDGRTFDSLCNAQLWGVK